MREVTNLPGRSPMHYMYLFWCVGSEPEPFLFRKVGARHDGANGRRQFAAKTSELAVASHQYLLRADLLEIIAYLHVRPCMFSKQRPIFATLHAPIHKASAYIAGDCKFESRFGRALWCMSGNWNAGWT